MSNRAETLKRIADESQRHYAAYTLFNQAMADRLGIHPTDLQCVALLDLEPGPVSSGELARLTGLTPSAATRLVDRLDKAGLVVRQTDPDDRRRALVALAPEARARISSAWEIPGRAFSEALDHYDEAELALIADFLRRAAAVGRAQAERLTEA